MSYVKPDPNWAGRTKIDVVRFTADLAKALGGKLLPSKYEGQIDSERYASFALDGAEIGISKVWNDRDKVTVNIGPIACKLGYNDTPRSADYKLPSAKVCVERPIDKIVADIKRRVIEPAKAPIAKHREHAANLAEQANDLQTTAARIRQQFPGLHVTVKDGSTYSAALYRNTDGGEPTP